GPARAAAGQAPAEPARGVLRRPRVPYRLEQDQHAPWPPGRCAAIIVTRADGVEQLAGHAGELHPRVVQAFRLPDRTCAMEVDLSVIGAAAAALPPARAPSLSAFPGATQGGARGGRGSVPAAA